MTPMRALYGYMLALAGYKVKAVSNGLESFAEIQVNRSDVIVTDIAMPVLSGLRLRVREDSLDQYRER
jgi:CheY-like chemotaxis protein